VDWIGHANALGGDIEGLSAAAANADPAQRQAAVAARGDTLAREREHVEQAPVHSGIAIGAAGVSAFAAAYRGEVGQVRTAAERLRAVANEGTGDAARAAAVRDASLAAQQAQLALAQHLQTDAQDTLSHTDLQHHTSLVTLLVLVAVSALAGVLLGQAAAGSITHPVSAVGSQLLRIGRGDFSPRVAIPNRDELGELAERLNAMTAELERLYAVEREGRRMAEALAERQRELNTEREFWAHTIVHDLSSPLAVASGYVELLREGKCGELSPRQAEATREVDESLRQVVRRTQDIIDLFRMEQAGVPIEARAESPVAILEAAKRTSQQPGYPPIGVDAAPDIGPVYGDRRLLQRVVENLIANAYRHGGPGVTVTLRAWRDGEQAVLAVEDNGFGVPAADRERVFELFQRASHSPRSSGLGLTFCKATVERHDGRIWIDDAPGDGTRVCFTLPFAPIPTAASASG
jgi:signal transduction histidine kinase